MMLLLSTLSKMSLKEEAAKYFCRTSWRFGQSRRICFTVKVASQERVRREWPIFSRLITAPSWRDRTTEYSDIAVLVLKRDIKLQPTNQPTNRVLKNSECYIPRLSGGWNVLEIPVTSGIERVNDFCNKHFFTFIAWYHSNDVKSTTYCLSICLSHATTNTRNDSNLHFLYMKDTRAVQPVATCCQSPYLHKPAIVTVTSFSLWRHSLLSWPHPLLQTYVRTPYRV